MTPDGVHRWGLSWLDAEAGGQVRIQLFLGRTDLRDYNDTRMRFFAYVRNKPCKILVNNAV